MKKLTMMDKAFDGSFNDAVLAMCAGALRRHMQQHSELPNDSLKSLVPVSVRAEGDIDSSNSVAMITVDLATKFKDPAKRFQVIQDSVRAGRTLFEGMSPQEIQLYTMLMNSPGLLTEQLGIARVPPPYNVCISNVPGIQEQVYWNGAKLDGSYPLSIVNHGMAMNITLVTMGQNVNFGIIACRRSVPKVQRLIDYMEEALVEMEVAAGLSVPPKKTKASPARKSGTRKAKPKAVTGARANTTAKPKPKAKSS